MPLREVGETCTIDYHELVIRLCQDFGRYVKVTSADKGQIEDMVKQMYDDYLSFRMRWTSTKSAPTALRYINDIRGLARTHPQRERVLNDTLDYVIDHLESCFEFPTWHVIHTQFRNGYVKFELGEDYRITDWMQRHGSKYGE